MNCINYDNNKKLGLLQFHSGYENFYLNSSEGYSRKIINAQTAVGCKPKSRLVMELFDLLLFFKFIKMFGKKKHFSTANAWSVFK